MALEGFCDADWASDTNDRKSTSGSYVFLGSNLISWQYNKQHVVPRSSAAAEYRSLAHLVVQITWISFLLAELNFALPKRPIVWCNTHTLSFFWLILFNMIEQSMLNLICILSKKLQRSLIVKRTPPIDQVVDNLIKSSQAPGFMIYVSNSEFIPYPL